MHPAAGLRCMRRWGLRRMKAGYSSHPYHLVINWSNPQCVGVFGSVRLCTTAPDCVLTTASLFTICFCASRPMP